MHVVITGATGFIGRALARRLRGRWQVVALSRDPARAAALLGGAVKVVGWDGRAGGEWAKHITGARAVVNLAGHNVASGRWSRARKRLILDSRLDCTAAVVEAIRAAEVKPGVLVQGSAIGYYGPRGPDVVDEDSPAGAGFLAEVCRRVEAAGRRVEAAGVRYVAIRTGVVLGSGGGALAKMAKPYRFWLGGYPGSGEQWFSWISLDDEVRAVEFLVGDDRLSGAFNLTSPEPVTMRAFSKCLGVVLDRPAWLAVPGLALRMALGQMAEEMLLAGQRVLPSRLLKAGFRFEHEQLEAALRAALGSS